VLLYALQFSTPSPNKNKKKKSGSGSKSPGNKPIKVDLRHTPFFLQDGDVIGVKVGSAAHLFDINMTFINAEQMLI